VKELRVHFIDGKPFQSPSLGCFADAIAVMPKLKKLYIYVHSGSYEDLFVNEEVLFFRFAFSNARVEVLWKKIKERFGVS
jgi:hypothetical protein